MTGGGFDLGRRLLGRRLSDATIRPGDQVRHGIDNPTTELSIDWPCAPGAVLLQCSRRQSEKRAGLPGGKEGDRGAPAAAIAP